MPTRGQIPGIEEKDADPARDIPMKPLRLSVAYLTISHASSFRITNARPKLLILDLNGTLLLRPKPRRAQGRPIHPRPFMPTFRSFLFHEKVKPWLEVRVWSSARPGNVNDMVERCFAESRKELKAVWARDTLGLTADDYSRKVQTSKDLEKHWSADLSGGRHSAQTTLLLDDSPLKAHLQPYNHCCIPEYTQNLRNRDLIAKKKITSSNTPKCELRKEVQVQWMSFSAMTFPHGEPHKYKDHEERDVQIETVRSDFDETLIAVIGILDEIRAQTNVAGWIRAGGLWAGQEPMTRKELLLGNHSEYDVTHGPRKESPTAGNDTEARIEQDLPMWFDHAPCLQYWVGRGTQAVESLGITLEHGME